MKNIPPEYWEIYHYLNGDEPPDEHLLACLFNQYPYLKEWLADDRTERENDNDAFDPVKAFEKLNQRIKKEKPDNA
jgi:hypothetical protein